MVLILVVLMWSTLIGLLAPRYSAMEGFLLLLGILAAVGVQYFVLGPS